MHKTLAVRELSIGVTLHHPRVAAEVVSYYEGWWEDRTARACLDVHLQPGESFAGLWTVRPRVARDSWVWEAPLARLTFFPAAHRARLVGHSRTPVAEVDYALRVLTALLAPQEDMLLLHAAAVGVEARAILFLGISGAGKSTAACSRPSGTVLLADDLVLLSRRGREWRLYPTPFDRAGRHLSSQHSYAPSPVLMCRLRQDNVVALYPHSAAQAAMLLLRSVPILPLAAATLPAVWQHVAAAASQVGAASLHFRPDGAHWPLLLQHLRARQIPFLLPV